MLSLYTFWRHIPHAGDLDNIALVTTLTHELDDAGGRLDAGAACVVLRSRVKDVWMA